MKTNVRLSVTILGILGLFSGVPSLAGGNPPIPVSPGAVGEPAVSGTLCPTFSWGLVAGASAYELEIVEIPSEFSGSEREADLIRVEFPGSVSSWTPAGVVCFPLESTLAWRIRARELGEWREWSERLVFRLGGPAPTVEAEGTEVAREPGSRRGTRGVGGPLSAPGLTEGFTTAPAASHVSTLGETGLAVSFEALASSAAAVFAELQPLAGGTYYGVVGTVPTEPDLASQTIGVYGEGERGVVGRGGALGVEGTGSVAGALFQGLDDANDPDIALAGNGLIVSDSDKDLILEAGDDVLIVLDVRGNVKNNNFIVRHDTTDLFRVADDGQVFVGNVLVHSSDRDAKTDLRSVDTATVLRRLSQLPLYRWRWREDPEEVEHLGPTAQDFHSAFGLGDDPRGIATVDADGVALAAIQEVVRLVERHRLSIERLERRLRELEGGDGCQ